MKRTPADDAFSKAIRERANWTCELCGTEHPDGQATGKARGLDCSHLFGRGNWSVRFDVDNAFAHCTACHFRFGSDRELQRKHHEEVFGEGLYQILVEKKHDTTIGRLAKRSNKEIKQHYLSEFERLREMRKEGITGRIELTNWN